MGNPATLQPKPFTSENQPANRKSRKGIPNRATVFKKLLKMKAGEVLPDAEEIEKDLTLIEAAALGQVLSARKGNTNAWKEIQDTLHGKMADKTEHSGKVELEVATFQIKTRTNEE
jgi:hypothetical protein